MVSSPATAADRRADRDHQTMGREWAAEGDPAASAPASELERTLAAGRTRSDPADGRLHAARDGRRHVSKLRPAHPGRRDSLRQGVGVPSGQHASRPSRDDAVRHGGLVARARRTRPGAGYEGLIAHSVASPDGFFLDWGPGHSPYVAPDGMAWPIRPGTDLVMMLHLRPSGRVETLQGTLGLYFSKSRPPAHRRSCD